MKKLGYLLVLAVLIFAACEEKLDYTVSSDLENKLVVAGGITTDTTAHEIKLTSTQDYFSTDNENMVTGAYVEITDGDHIFELTEIKDGIYQTKPTVHGEIGKTYTLIIITDDNKTYTASETIQALPEIDSITLTENYNHADMQFDRFGYGYDILYYGPEPEGTGNFYLWTLYLNDELYTDTITETIFTDDEFVDGEYIFDFSVYWLRDEDIVKDTNKVELKMESISAEHYDFITGLMLETVWKGSPWDGPPANVPTNMEGGALGYFSATAVKRKSIELLKSNRKE